MATAQKKCKWKCLGWFILSILLICEFIALPTVGLVWWFATKPPVMFLQTCLGIALLWIGLGVSFFLCFVGVGKYRELKTRHGNPDTCA